MTSDKEIRPRKKAVQERSKFTVNAIFEAAVQVFTENGYAGATTDSIAERAGVSIGTLYQYFPNKKAILIGIWERGMSDADARRDAFASGSWEGPLDAGKIRTLFETVLAIHKAAVRPHLFFEEVPQPDFIKERLLQKETAVIHLFTEILERGDPLRHRPAIAARVIFEITERLIHRYLTHFKEEMSEAELIDEATDLLSRYLFDDVRAKPPFE